MNEPKNHQREDEMNRAVAASRSEERAGASDAAREPNVQVPTATLERLERLATANLLASGLAHEIANPLGSLTAAVSALEGRLGTLRARTIATAADLADMTADLELASVSTDELANLVRDFQQFLRPGEASSAAPEIDLKPPIVRALRMARARLGGITPVSVALGDAPAVQIAPGRVTQIVLNLLLNAADALAGRPWSANLVEIRLETVGGWAVIDVKDNGPGLDTQARKHLFEIGASTKTAGGSLGLGLAICRELARASGGEVSVSSPLAPGTLFRVVLPPASLGPQSAR